MQSSDEVILDKSSARSVLFPIVYYDIWNFYKKSLSSFWIAEEIDFSKDLKDWEALDDNERCFIGYILAFFNCSDIIVNNNLLERFLQEVQVPEIKLFYGFQFAIENIHTEVYGLIIETYIKNSNEKIALLEAVENIESIRKKTAWMNQWIHNQNASFAERIIAFACVEGIFFSGSFAAIFWLKNRGLLPGLSFSNELISRDEGLHCDFAVNLMNRHIKNKPSNETITKIINQAVSIEKDFFREAMPVDLKGINFHSMQKYIEFIADRLLMDLKCEKIYNAENPFSFMDFISLEGKTNFFERRVSEYKKFGVCDNNYEFKLDDEAF